MIFLISNELKNCYSNAVVLNNENLKTATVVLTTSENPDCEQFLDEVQLDLNFHDGFPTVSFIYSKFNYSSTEEIIMRNITIVNTRDDKLTMPLFSRLNISNLAFWTMVRVSYLGTQQSQMDQCFQVQESTFQLFQEKFEFMLYLTNACLTEIMDMSFQFQYQFGSSAETIEIRRKEDFPDDFNCEVLEGDIMKCTVEKNFVQDIQTPFLHPVVDFFIKNNGVEYKTQIQFENVLIGIIQNLVTTAVTQFFKDIFYVDFNLTQNDTLMAQWQELIADANMIIYRITVNYDGAQTQFQFDYEDFDPNRQILTQSCQDNQECLQQMTFINSISQKAQFYMDITAFNGNDLLATTGLEFYATLSCFRRVVIKIQDTKNICFQMEKSAYFEDGPHCQKLKDNYQTEFSVQTINSSDIYQKCFEAVTDVVFKFESPEVCFYCPKCTDQIIQIKEDTMFVLLTMTQGSNSVITLGFQWQYDGYSTVNIVVITISSIIILWALFDSIHKVVIFIRVSKNYKRKK